MKSAQVLALAAATVLGAAILVTPAKARDGGIAVSCSNGRTYFLQPTARTVRDEVVAARFALDRHRRIKMRLVPMGDGYRYAGRGVWLDGVGTEASLEIWKRPPLSCAID